MDWWTRLIWWTYRHAWFNTDLDISLKHSPEWYIDASFPYVYLHSDYNDIGDGDDNGDDDDDDADISDGDYDDIDIKDEFLMFLPSLTAFCSWFTKMLIDDNCEDDGDDDDDDSDDDDSD